jgi:Domain of unknown function (DUF4116)
MSDLRSRLNKIIDLHGQALAEAVGQREPTSAEAQLSNKDIILHFAENDPTDGKSRTQWLVKTYIQDERFKLEDLGRVDAALAAFERFKRKLPVEQREISHLKTLSALEALVNPFVKAEAKARLERDLSTATGREKRRLEELKARDESIVVQEGDGLPTIAVPMTEFASKWWGRGTKWCTSAEKNNAFARYHKNAPLVIIVCPDGAKFQMNVKKDDFQFMDNTDKDVSQHIIQERWSEFEALFYWAVQQEGRVLEFVPKEYRNLELYSLAIEQNGQALVYVPEEYRTPELCRLAIEQNGCALKYVPHDYRTSELCRVAVARTGNALQDVPEKYMTLELCRLAVEQDGEALGWVPEKYRTPELDYMAVEQNGEALKYVPIEYRTPELCRLAVEQNGEALGDVPAKLKTPELCRMAVEQNGHILYSIPESKRTLKLCRIAVEQNGHALQYVPEKHKTPELCRLALQQNGWTLKYLPKDERTLDLCCIAVEQNGEALQFVPEKYRTPKLMALISVVQPKWHPDVLQGLGLHFRPACESICSVSS